MQKALITALLFGAFLFSHTSLAEDPDPELPPQYECLTGGVYEEHPELGHICKGFPDAKPTYEIQAFSMYHGTTESPHLHCVTELMMPILENAFSGNEVTWRRSEITPSGDSFFCGVSFATRFDSRFDWYERNTIISYNKIPSPKTCPPMDATGLINNYGSGDNHICWIEATLVVDEPPPECDIGDCDPPEEPQCFRGGNGQLVCFEDPNEKCDVSIVNGEPVYMNCETGCGFVQDNFICSEEPDIPSLDDCIVTTNGYACPPEIPEPDDDIENPEKPINDMVKGDFKDVLRGVETRTDATNKLLADQIARDAENTEKLAVGLGKANQYLSAIDKNTKETAEALKGLSSDGEALDLGNNSQYKSEIQAALGLTGEESIDDLTVSEVNLGSLKDDFAFSLGSSACPQPRAINMLGKTFYMEWSPFCQAFTVMGYLIMAAAYFFAAMIAFKGK